GLPVLSLAALGAVPVNVALLRFPSFSIARTKKSSIILSPFYQILVLKKRVFREPQNRSVQK
ncbi:MAG: hypothetical protein IJQ33_07235, partial [Clostridia bacterium]|nr:hypothetical protein [Clostridia bacterium]